jgi:hypothetical protein
MSDRQLDTETTNDKGTARLGKFSKLEAHLIGVGRWQWLCLRTAKKANRSAEGLSPAAPSRPEYDIDRGRRIS